MESRARFGVAKGALITVGLLLGLAVVVVAAVVATMKATGASLDAALLGVVPGLGWGGLTFACGWWFAMRRHERVGTEVATVLLPLHKELKHLRAQLAQRAAVDDSAKTSVHPRRVAVASDEAKTTVACFDRAREAVR